MACCLCRLGSFDDGAYWISNISILPDILTWPLLASGIGIAFFAKILTESWPGPSLSEALLGSGVGFFGLWFVREAYRRLRGREGLGLGDVKPLWGCWSMVRR